jgi:hypothetical protein
VSRITRRMVRARSGFSAPRQPSTTRSLCRAKSRMAEPGSPCATARRMSMPSRPPPVSGRETLSPTPAIHAAVGRHSGGIPSSPARRGGSRPGVATCSTMTFAAAIVAKSLAGPIVAALVGVPSWGASSRCNAQLWWPRAGGTTQRDGAWRRGKDICGHAPERAQGHVCPDLRAHDDHGGLSLPGFLDDRRRRPERRSTTHP